MVLIRVVRFACRSSYQDKFQSGIFFMQITNTGNLGPMILQSLAPSMLYTPTAAYNYITVCDKVSMPAGGGTTCRFMRPRALQPPTVQLGNSGIDPPAQVPQRDIIDADMAFFGTGCIINEQVILQDQEGYALAA
jgi:hypothetical protein